MFLLLKRAIIMKLTMSFLKISIKKSPYKVTIGGFFNA